MIEEWIESYNPRNEEDIISSLREIMQEITLAGLSRTDFFEHAAFYGGTALRIFYNLDRFSEDLDFSLLAANPDFSLEPYFKAIIDEFAALGLYVSLKEKEKRMATNIESAFLKSDTIWKELVLIDVLERIGVKSNKSVKIKIEVDRMPPLGFQTEHKLLLRPHSFYVNCFSKSSLFAGKLHALLFRKWKNRVKGRDWYDLEFYIQKGIPLNVNHFLQRAIDTNDWKQSSITPEQILDLLQNKIKETALDKVRQDVSPFIKETRKIDIWTSAYFVQLIDNMTFEE